MKAFIQGWSATWRRVISDAGARLLLIVAPIFYSLFYPLPYLNEVVREVPFAVVDLDHSSLSRQLIRVTDAHETLRVAERVDSEAEAEEAVKSGRVRGYLVVPASFRRDVLAGHDAVIGYGGDASYFLLLKQVLTGFGEAAGALNAGIKLRHALAATPVREQARISVAPLTLRAHPVGNTREGYSVYLIPSVFLLILQQTLLLGVGLLAGTLRERATGGTPSVGAFGGVIAALVALYAVHSVFHVGIAAWIYDLPTRSNLLQLACFMLPFLLACVLFALAASAFCTRRESSVHLFLVTSIPFLFIAGTSWPFEMMPPPLPWLARLIPSTAGLQGVVRLNSLEAQWSEISGWWALLWALIALYVWPAWRGWRRLGLG